MNIIKLISIIGTIILLSTCGNSPSGVYNVYKVCRTSSNLTLNTVEIKSDRTILSLTYCNNNKYSSSWAKTAAPGTNQAFYIKDTQSEKKYELLDTENIAISPNRTYLNVGECFTFKLVFNRIDITSFHLIEGENNQYYGEVPFNFTNVELKK